MESEILGNDDEATCISKKDNLLNECSSMSSQCSDELKMLDADDTNNCEETINVAFVLHNGTLNSVNNSSSSNDTSIKNKFKSKLLIENLFDANDNLPVNENNKVEHQISKELETLNYNFTNQICTLSHVHDHIADMIQEINQRLIKLNEHEDAELKILNKLPDECEEIVTTIMDTDGSGDKESDDIVISKIVCNDLIKASKIALCDEEEIRNCNELCADVSLNATISELNKSVEIEAAKNDMTFCLSPTTAECDTSSEKSFPPDELSVISEEEIVANYGYTPRVLEIINEMKEVSPRKQCKIMKLYDHTLSDLERETVTKFMNTEWKSCQPGFWKRLSLHLRHSDKCKISNKKLHKKNNLMQCWRRRKITSSSNEEQTLNNLDGVENTSITHAEVQPEQELKEMSLD